MAAIDRFVHRNLTRICGGLLAVVIIAAIAVHLGLK